jgi:heme/copper-type cytochrome/quinol oxidase subunit 3
MILFIASEVMFFVAWFWAYFNTALFPPMLCNRAPTPRQHPAQRGSWRAMAAEGIEVRPGICRCSIR